MNPEILKGLASTLIEKGAPVLGSIVSSAATAAIGGPIGPIISILPEVAQAFGLPANAGVEDVAKAVQEAPDAADKLSGLEAAQVKAKSDQDYLNSQIEANASLASVGDSFWSRFIMVGARPSMLWVSGPIVLLYQIAAYGFGLQPIPMDFFAATQATFAGLAGVRSVEKWKGIATSSIPKRG